MSGWPGYVFFSSCDCSIYYLHVAMVCLTMFKSRFKPPSILILTVPRRYFCCGFLLLLVLALRVCTLVRLLSENGRGSSIGSEFAWHASGPEFDPHVRHILSWRLGHENISTATLPLPLIQEEQLSVTGERMCTKYW